MKKCWSVWCKSLGSRISECDKESDIACILRTVYAIVVFITSFFIIANAIHHW